MYSTTMSTTSPVRVRFAPSPTGFLHIGGVRTALFNWLYARHNSGKFLLRIEDTDLERSEEQFTLDIISSMRWLGLTWDEEPLFQAKRLNLYRRKAEELVAAGHAYYCDCTEAEVEQMREKAMTEGKRPQYNRHCRDLAKKPDSAKPSVIRAKLPLDGFIEFNDLIRGPIRVANADIDDFVLLRSNAAPTYNLSVVVDDVESGITQIIRGDDHINNTPKQMHLYRFFNYQIPEFAHLPMILGPDKKKLSKRHGAVSTNLYRSEGYLPEALLNFLARLGWSHGDQEIFSINEMIEYFTFDNVQKSSGVFNAEKLLWLNGEYIRKTDPARLANIIYDDFNDYFKPPSALARINTTIGIKLVSFIQQKVKLVREVAEQIVPLCTPGPVEVDASELKWNKDQNLKTVVKGAVKRFAGLLAGKIGSGPKSIERHGADAAWGSSPALSDVSITATELDAMARQMCEQHGIKLGELAQPIRLTISGRMVSAGLFELLASLPWDVIEPRLKKIDEL